MEAIENPFKSLDNVPNSNKDDPLPRIDANIWTLRMGSEPPTYLETKGLELKVNIRQNSGQ